MTNKKVFIMVDLQNDFCAGGSLAVPGADEVISLANQLQQQFDFIVATQDWHPRDHMSFAANHPGKKVGDVILLEDTLSDITVHDLSVFPNDHQGHRIPQILWPVHCVQHTSGAAFHPLLATQKIQKIFYKGTDKTIDSYSAFFDNAHRRATGLSDYLRAHGVIDVYLMGLATDYCVNFSALDAVHEEFNVYVIADACRGVDLQPGDSARALKDMQAAGVKLV